jgi:hypothetical protein
MVVFRKIIIYVVIALMAYAETLQAQQEPSAKNITIRSSRHTVFSLLSEVSRQSGYFFIYDSELIDNSRRVNISKGEYSLDEILARVIGDADIQVTYRDMYVILHLRPLTAPTAGSPAPASSEKDSLIIVVNGRIIDSQSGAPLSYASVVINGKGKGTSANAEGVFAFKTTHSHVDDTLRISYLGYASRMIPVKLLTHGMIDIYMDLEPRTLQEVVIRGFNPIDILFQSISAITENYPPYPTLQTSFYREGIFRNDELLNYSEAIFDIYKHSYKGNPYDQVKLVRSRNISNNDARDTLVIKLKAGIQSMLELDVVKHPPGFLMHNQLDLYKFTGVQMMAHEHGYVYVISFEVNDNTDEGIYNGTLYIDVTSMAIVQVDFRIAPSYLSRNQQYFITRRSRMHVSRIRSMKYSVRYALHNGRYHVQHVRGEIDMRIRSRGKLIGRDYNAFFEMAVMKIETENVKRFARRETQKPNVIFSDEKFKYDPTFWENFNFVIPESEITSAIENFNAAVEIEETDD